MIKTGVAYLETRNPRHVREDLEDIVSHGCDFVIHAYSEFDFHFHSLVMREIVKISHDLGLEVYLNPWGLGKVFGGIEPLSRFVAEYPDQCQRMNDGSHAPIACLHSRPFRDLMLFWIDAAADAGADILFWDEPHYHYSLDTLLGKGQQQRWACACERCRDLFRAQFKRALPQALDQEVIRFRDDAIIEFLSELTDYAQKKGLKNAVCVLPDENPIVGVSTWESLARIPSLSIFGTDPYWMLYDKPLEEYVSQKSRRVIELCSRYGKEAQIWVQAFLIPAGREKEVGRTVEVIAAEGVKNIAAWAYLGTAFMNHKCADHQKVWDVLGEAYKKIKNQDMSDRTG